MILRDGVLEGVAAVVSAAPAVGERLAALGASVAGLDVDPHGEDVTRLDGRVDVLVHAAPGEPRAALDGAWIAIRAATERLTSEGGQIQLLAPAPGDAHAQAARAGLENLARTLSIEWARFDVRPVAILPGESTRAEEVAELVAFLASPAGEYYSGCAFTLA